MITTSAASIELAECASLTEKIRLLEGVLNAAPGLIAYWDRDRRARFANATFLEWFGKSGQAIIGMHMRDVLGPELFARNEPYVVSALAGHRQQFERAIKKPDGAWVYSLANYIPDVGDDGQVKGFFVLVSDVSDLKRSQLDLEWLSQMLDASPSAIAATDDMGRILRVNPQFCKLLGVTREAALQTSIDAVGSNPNASLFNDLLSRVGDTGTWKGHVPLRTVTGGTFTASAFVWILMTETSGDVARVVFVFNDATSEIAHEEELLKRASYDELTDLPNRAMMHKQLERLIKRSNTDLADFAAMFIDLDGFKKINDGLGHDVGDMILRRAAVVLQDCVRKSDTVARLGGDEFVVLLADPVDQAEVAAIAERILSEIRKPILLADQSVEMTASIGIALHQPGGLNAEDLIKQADSAMYDAKRAGRNHYRFAGSIKAA